MSLGPCQRCKHLLTQPCVVIRSGEAHNVPKHARAYLARAARAHLAHGGYAALLATAHEEAIVPCMLAGRLRRAKSRRGAVQNWGKPADRSQPTAPELVATRDAVSGAGNDDEGGEVVRQLVRQR